MLRQFIFIAFISFIKTQESPTELYPSKQALSPTFTLYWKHDETEITFEIHYSNATWALFGVKSDMYSDVIVGWMNSDGTGHYSDRKLVHPNQTTIDSQTNWIPLGAFKQNNHTVFKFKRHIKLNCNEASEDLDINLGPVDIVFMTGDLVDHETDEIKFDSVSSTKIDLLIHTNGTIACPFVPPKPSLKSQPTEKYDQNLELIPGVYKLFWNYTDTDIVAEIHCKTDGWVAFGFSPNGGMHKSDVVVGWISNGRVNFTDRHINERQVLIDQNQDWKLLFSSESNGINVFKFTRKIKLCDSDDLTIDQGSPYIIYAFGKSDPAFDQDISYHGMNRGGKVVNFISAPVETENTVEDDVEYLDSTISNVILPNDDTFYYCEAFAVPKNFTQKRHIFKWELILSDMNAERMHHALIYECSPSYNGTPGFQSGSCYKSEVKSKYCHSIAFAWAYGGKNIEIYPSDKGYPIGGDTDYSYFVFEIHYDNPEQTFAFIDNLTWRFYLTKNLREKELGVLTVGTDSSAYGIAIPPGVDYFPIKTYCSINCTRDYMKDNITIISAIPHTHLSGVDVWTKIVRKGKDIGYLFRNKYYDFNYQTSYSLNPYVNITSDDELITQCGYQAKGKSEFVFGGPSTRQEMCFQFLTYYPRKPTFKNCLSVPYPLDYAMFLMELNRTGKALVPKIENDFNSIIAAMGQMFATIQVDDEVRKMFGNLYNTTRYNAICSDKIFGPFNQTKPTNVFTEVDECSLIDSKPERQNLLNFVLTILKQIFNSFMLWFKMRF